MKSLLYGGALAALGVAVYLYYRYRKSQKEEAAEKKFVITPDQKVVDGMVKFADVVAWFKGLHLDKEKDTPFVANLRAAASGNDKISIKDIIADYVPVKECALFLGVYNEMTEEVTHALIIEADALDDKTKEVLGDESLVVLS